MNERLQEIKRKVMTFNQELRELDLEEHVDWLIEQAEKVERYKQALEEILNADFPLEGLDAERELDRVTDIAFIALEGEENE